MKPRRIFQIDGQDRDVLSVAERPGEDKVILIISKNGSSDVEISLSEESYMALADLRYSLRFNEEKEVNALKKAS